MNRKTITKWDAVILVSIIIVALVLWFFLGATEDGNSVTVTVNGEHYGEYSLSEYEVYTIDSTPSLKLNIDEHGASIIEAQCHDKLCEAAGVLHRAGQVAVCMPARVVVNISGGGSDIDIMTE